MAFGESADQGLTRGQNFYHADMGIAITAPAGWKIQNEPSELALFNAARDAALMIQVAPPKAGTTHDEIIRNLLKPSQGRTERLTINGLAGHAFCRQPGQQPGRAGNRRHAGDRTQRHRVCDDPRRQKCHRAAAGQNRIGAGPGQFSRHDGVKTAPPPGLGHCAPRLIPPAALPELAQRSPLPQAEAQLRLINGYYGGGEPREGQLVKVVE